MESENQMLSKNGSRPTRSLSKILQKKLSTYGILSSLFVASLSVIYAESNTSPAFPWDSFGVFSYHKSLPTSTDDPGEKGNPTRFFSAFSFKDPYEIKVFQGDYPEERSNFDAFLGFPTRASSTSRISLQRRETLALQPALGREEIYILSLLSTQMRDSKGEPYVGASTERRAYDGLTDVRSTVAFLPGMNQNASRGMENQAGNLLLGYLVGRAGIQMDVGWRMAGNTVGLAIPESAKSSIGFSYSLVSNASNLSRMDFFLQLSGIKRFNDRSLLTVEAPPAFRGWQQGYEYYVNPGFSISTRNVSLEGAVRLPLHQPFPNTDGMLTPEIQGVLGLKYRFSESSPNLPK